MTHARVAGGSATELSVTDKCQGRSGDGFIRFLLCPVVDIKKSSFEGRDRLRDHLAGNHLHLLSQSPNDLPGVLLTR
jgi:hypothetical protein